jgi:hypothetical protein
LVRAPLKFDLTAQRKDALPNAKESERANFVGQKPTEEIEKNLQKNQTITDIVIVFFVV